MAVDLEALVVDLRAALKAGQATVAPSLLSNVVVGEQRQKAELKLELSFRPKGEGFAVSGEFVAMGPQLAFADKGIKASV